MCLNLTFPDKNRTISVVSFSYSLQFWVFLIPYLQFVEIKIIYTMVCIKFCLAKTCSTFVEFISYLI